jgi:transcriptional regulator with XRE-family HTH domain
MGLWRAKWIGCDPVATESLTERLAALLREAGERRGFKKALADELHVSQSAITPYVNGERAVTLDMLEAIAKLTNTPIAELVAPPGDTVRQLRPDEAEVLRALRKWPVEVSHALLSFVRFFADEEPAAGQTRNLHQIWRTMRQHQRDQLYGFAAHLAAGSLPPETVETLFAQLSAESKAATGKKHRHR